MSRGRPHHFLPWLLLCVLLFVVLVYVCVRRLPTDHKPSSEPLRQYNRANGELNSENEMPWETGVWPARSKSKRTVPTLLQVAEYANSIRWTTGPDARLDGVNPTLESGTQATRHRFLHVINPFYTKRKDIADAQRMAMASIEGARAWSEYVEEGKYTVDVVALEFSEEDATLLRPTTFLRRVQRSSNNSTTHAHLPLLRDILLAGLEEANRRQYDYVIFTNSDILLLPHFYAVVSSMLNCHRTFFINRVEIPETAVSFPTKFHLGQGEPDLARPLNLKTIALAYDYALTWAQNHPGYDCFVAQRASLTKVAASVGDVFIGFPPCGAILAEAAKTVDRHCIATRKVPATFHIGSRNGNWDNGSEELLEANGLLARNLRPKKRPKCRALALQTKGRGPDSKCFPLQQFYPTRKGVQAMFPADYEDMLRLRLRKNATKSRPSRRRGD